LDGWMDGFIGLDYIYYPLIHFIPFYSSHLLAFIHLTNNHFFFFERIEVCVFSGYKIYPGHGKRYVRADSRVSFHFFKISFFFNYTTLYYLDSLILPCVSQLDNLKK